MGDSILWSNPGTFSRAVLVHTDNERIGFFHSNDDADAAKPVAEGALFRCRFCVVVPGKTVERFEHAVKDRFEDSFGSGVGDRR